MIHKEKQNAILSNLKFEQGKFYACFSEDINIKEELKYLRTDLNIKFCFEDYSLFKRIKVGKLLGKYGFTSQEILSILEELNLKNNDNADKICHVTIKAYLLIDILFKKSDVVVFFTSGLSYKSREKIYRRIYEKLKIYPEKSAVVFELIPFYDGVNFEIVSNWHVDNYIEWRTSHEVESPYYIKIREYKDIDSFCIEKGIIYSCFTQISNLASKLSSANYPNIIGTTGFFYNNPKIFMRLIRNPFWKVHYTKKEIDKMDTFKKASLLIDLSFSHWGKVILFETKYWPVEIIPDIMNYIYNKHLEFPHKTIIIFEETKGYGKTSFEILNK